jgi:hypothetical protein
MVGLIMLENNCTNCKYIIPVEGADYGFCNFKTRLGDIANVHTVCSDYEAKPKANLYDPATYSQKVKETLQALRCCTDPKLSCAVCPFRKYKHTCQRDLMSAAEEVISYLLIKIDSSAERLEDLYKELEMLELKAIEKSDLEEQQ